MRWLQEKTSKQPRPQLWHRFFAVVTFALSSRAEQNRSRSERFCAVEGPRVCLQYDGLRGISTVRFRVPPLSAFFAGGQELYLNDRNHPSLRKKRERLGHPPPIHLDQPFRPLRHRTALLVSRGAFPAQAPPEVTPTEQTPSSMVQTYSIFSFYSSTCRALGV